MNMGLGPVVAHAVVVGGGPEDGQTLRQEVLQTRSPRLQHLFVTTKKSGLCAAYISSVPPGGFRSVQWSNSNITVFRSVLKYYLRLQISPAVVSPSSDPSLIFTHHETVGSQRRWSPCGSRPPAMLSAAGHAHPQHPRLSMRSLILAWMLLRWQAFANEPRPSAASRRKPC